MNYTSDFHNPLLHIRVITNNKQVLKLIEHYVDFKKDALKPGHRRIFIKFYIYKVSEGGNNRFFVRSSLDDKSNIVRSYISKLKRVRRSVVLWHIFVLPLHCILQRLEYHFIHTAVLTKDKTLYFISGLPNSGKSITALNLRANKFRLLSDDNCFVKIDNGRVRIIPFPTKAGINKKNIQRHSRFKEESRRNFPLHGKLRISISDTFAASEVKPRRIILLFPKYTNKKNLSLKRISRQRALYLLAYVNIQLHKDKEYLRECTRKFALLSEFISKTEPFILSYNDGNIPAAASFLERRLLDFNNRRPGT